MVGQFEEQVGLFLEQTLKLRVEIGTALEKHDVDAFEHQLDNLVVFFVDLTPLLSRLFLGLNPVFFRDRPVFFDCNHLSRGSWILVEKLVE